MIKGFTDFNEIANFDEIEAHLYQGYFKTNEKFPWEGKILYVGDNYCQILAEFRRYGILYKIRRWNLFSGADEPEEIMLNDLEGGYRQWLDMTHEFTLRIKSYEDELIQAKSKYAAYDWYYDLNSLSIGDTTPSIYSQEHQLASLAYKKIKQFFNQLLYKVLVYIQDEKNPDYETDDFSSIWERLKYDVYHADPPIFEDAITSKCYKELEKLNLDSVDIALLWIYSERFDPNRQNGPEEDMKSEIARSMFNALYKYAEQDNDENGELW